MYLWPLANVGDKHSQSYLHSITDNYTRTFTSEENVFVHWIIKPNYKEIHI